MNEKLLTLIHSRQTAIRQSQDKIIFLNLKGNYKAIVLEEEKISGHKKFLQGVTETYCILNNKNYNKIDRVIEDLGGSKYEEIV